MFVVLGFGGALLFTKANSVMFVYERLVILIFVPVSNLSILKLTLC